MKKSAVYGGSVPGEKYIAGPDGEDHVMLFAFNHEPSSHIQELSN